MNKILISPYTDAEYAEFANLANGAGKVFDVQSNGDIYLVDRPKPPPETIEEQKAFREMAYRSEVDPITAHIARLRDMEPESEELSALVSDRAEKVEAIRTRFPYPEGAE